MARIIWNNLVDSATITATTENASYDADNVALQSLGLRWRSTADTDPTYLNFDLGSAQAVQACVIWGHNFTSSAVVSLQGDDSSDYSSLTVDETMTVQTGLTSDGFNHDFAYIWLSGPESYRYWRIKIANDSSNPDNYFEVARVFLGTYFTFPVADNTYQAGWVDRSEAARSRGGAVHVYTRPKYRMAIAQSRFLEETEKDTLTKILRNNGKSVDVVWSAFPEDGDTQERDHTILGYIEDFGMQSYRTFQGGTLRSVANIEIAENI